MIFTPAKKKNCEGLQRNLGIFVLVGGKLRGTLEGKRFVFPGKADILLSDNRSCGKVLVIWF